MLRSGPMLVALVALGCAKSAAAPAEIAALASLDVEIVEATTEPVPTTIGVVGTLRPSRESELAAGAAGRVVATPVERGASVRAGELVARLDVRAAALAASEARAAARSAATQARFAALECERSRLLHQRGALSQEEYERSVAQCDASVEARKAAAARAGLAGKSVGDGLIRAPFAGVVNERWVNVGEFVREDSRVVSLVALDPLRLELRLPERRLGVVRGGQRVDFRVRAHETRSFSATIGIVGSTVRPLTRDFVVEAEVSNAEGLLRPGMFATAEIELEARPQIVVPTRVIRRRDGDPRVFVVVDGVANERSVDLGPTRGDRGVVRKGIALGDRMVRDPPEALRNGQAVN